MGKGNVLPEFSQESFRSRTRSFTCCTSPSTSRSLLRNSCQIRRSRSIDQRTRVRKSLILPAFNRRRTWYSSNKLNLLPSPRLLPHSTRINLVPLRWLRQNDFFFLFIVLMNHFLLLPFPFQTSPILFILLLLFLDPFFKLLLIRTSPRSTPLGRYDLLNNLLLKNLFLTSLLWFPYLFFLFPFSLVLLVDIRILRIVVGIIEIEIAVVDGCVRLFFRFRCS